MGHPSMIVTPQFSLKHLNHLHANMSHDLSCRFPDHIKFMIVHKTYCSHVLQNVTFWYNEFQKWQNLPNQIGCGTYYTPGTLSAVKNHTSTVVAFEETHIFSSTMNRVALFC
jgi:hypothetical protein